METETVVARVNVNQAAAASGVSRRTLYYWMASGRLPFVGVGSARRVAVADVERCRVYKKLSTNGAVDA